jgi:AraC-like DNA-binding protein
MSKLTFEPANPNARLSLVVYADDLSARVHFWTQGRHYDLEILSWINKAPMKSTHSKADQKEWVIAHPEMLIRVGTVKPVPQLLRSLGYDPRAVLAEIGFDIKLFDDPDSLMPYSLRNRMLDQCAKATGFEHFGLLVGSQLSLSSFGLLGQLASSSPDVRTALENLANYFHFHARGATVSLQDYGETAVLGYHIMVGCGDSNRQISDGIISFMFTIMQELCGPRWKPSEIWAMHRQAEDLEPYRKFFDSPLCFDSDFNAVLFDSDWLKAPLPGYQQETYRELQDQLDLFTNRNPEDFPELVQTAMAAGLIGEAVSEDGIAAQFGLHPRAFRRRLVSCQTSYRELLDVTRFGIARQLLADSALATSDIALRLQYSNTRTFIRAFKRWSGETPASWRANLTTGVET